MYKNKFYNGTWLMTAKDNTGEDARVRIAVSKSRSAGKTHFMGSWLLDCYFETGRRFILLCRRAVMIGHTATGILDRTAKIEYGENCSIKEVVEIKGTISKIIFQKIDPETKELIIDEVVGYVCALTNYGRIKTIGQLFDGVKYIFFDEFQPVDSRYLSGEVQALMSIYDTANRGDGVRSGDCEIILTSNAIDFNNPYFEALGVTKYIQPNTRKARGFGFVYQCADVPNISEDFDKNPLHKALRQNIKLNEDLDWTAGNADIIKKISTSKYKKMPSIWDNGNIYEVIDYPTLGIIYVRKQRDKTNAILSFIPNDTYRMIKRNETYYKVLKNAYLRAELKYENSECKSMIQKYIK